MVFEPGECSVMEEQLFDMFVLNIGLTEEREQAKREAQKAERRG